MEDDPRRPGCANRGFHMKMVSTAMRALGIAPRSLSACGSMHNAAGGADAADAEGGGTLGAAALCARAACISWLAASGSSIPRCHPTATEWSGQATRLAHTMSGLDADINHNAIVYRNQFGRDGSAHPTFSACPLPYQDP